MTLLGISDLDMRNNTNFKHRFAMPDLYYSFDLGYVHYIMLNSSPLSGHYALDPYDALLSQYNWLVRDLEIA